VLLVVELIVDEGPLPGQFGAMLANDGKASFADKEERSGRGTEGPMCDVRDKQWRFARLNESHIDRIGYGRTRFSDPCAPIRGCSRRADAPLSNQR
jgi:hypothetical protein